MAATDSMTTGASLAQPTIDAIQQKIAALLPGSVAAAITSQFAGGSGGSGSTMPPQVSGMGPAMSFVFPGSGGGSGSTTMASPAQPTIDAIKAQIAALLPSDLASAITSQFAGASTGSGGTSMPVPSSTGSMALVLPSAADINTFLSIPQTA